MPSKKILLSVIFILSACMAMAQTCPANVGFETGDFTGWQSYTGIMEQTGTAPISWISGAAVPGRHTILQNASPQALDPYGNFPVNSPNGSKYSLLLGNSSVGGGGKAQSERMTFDFVVPTDDYTLVYYYAVVFQNPNDHNDDQQPKFIANVTNLDNPQDQQCGSFSFTSSAGLQGFQKSSLGASVYYKPWSPLTIKLSGRKGQRIELEFITRDCSKGGHFGYAYVDFNENCASAITGSAYCTGINTVTLTAPSGFQQYTWTDDAGTTLSTTPTLKVSPPPPDGTTYTLHIIPYEGLGCENVFKTSVRKIDEVYNLEVVPDISGCKANGIDLTQGYVTAGSSPGQKFEYYTDPNGQDYLSDPKLVTQSGTYYIRGSNAYGCTDIKPVVVTMYEGAAVATTIPVPACVPATVDLTKTVTSTDAGVTYNYYSDAALKTTVSNPTAITQTGSYFVKATSVVAQCITVKQINVVISTLPVATNQVMKGCPPMNINISANTDNAGTFTYTYYTDAKATMPLADPAHVTLSGKYYYRMANVYGCLSNIASIDVTVYAPPYFKVLDPAPVVFPEVINLADTHIPLTTANFGYFLDSAAAKPVTNYQTVDKSGTYYIKATSTNGCTVINPVHVLINAPPEPDLIVGNTFTPNGDGINDEFRPVIKGVVKMNYIRIYNRYGQQIFETQQLLNRWTGYINGKAEPTGTYYWVFSCYDIYRKKEYTRSGPITLIR